MAIGGYITGATQGIIYVRAEYPLAVHRLKVALAQARDYGVLGDDILGRGFKFDIDLVEGAGAFVCGEETALISSLEGRSGRPRPRPPFPAQKGLWGYPTNINNVETWFNIAPIVAKGPAWFTETGSNASAGTKVFSLVGKVKNTGLVEMPLGTPLSSFVYDAGAGSMRGHPVKAVQTGGPSGGCIPHELFDTPVDYESLGKLGSIMGSGGMVVMDDDNCMVDVARYFIEFTRSEFCGKCTPCRVGLDKALRTLTRITKGEGREEDLAELNELGRMIRDTSLCGLGQSAPNSILTTLRHFHHEFEDHIRAKRCRAGVCQDLALSPCENSCPLHMNIPRFLQLYKEGRLEDAFESVIMDNPLPASTGRVCQHPCDDRCRRQTRRRSGQHARSPSRDRRFGAAVGSVRRDGRPHRRQAPRADRQHGRRGGRRPDRPDRRLLSRAAGPRRHRLRIPRRSRRHAALRPAGISAAQGGPRSRDRDHPPPRRPLRLQHADRRRHSAQRSRRQVRRGVPVDRHLEGRLGLSSPAPN